MSSFELLAPAKDLKCGIAAINCGADAVYVGASQFGAREDAGNPLDDVAALIHYAHTYWARVYVTVNTLLRDEELDAAVRLIHEVYERGADGLIIQDAGLLECDLPPIPLIASTQMQNHTPERVAFLEQVGFSRVILARELDLEQIRAIRRAAPRIELEAFVHGALCVCYSGQCYLSYAVGGRSGNRGQCAQPCRKRYDLVDANGRLVVWGHLLSLRDLNLSDHLEQLIDAGVTSFKIEGRLKGQAYVANTVAHYRACLDNILAQSSEEKRSSSGRSILGFSPNVEKTFNRGYTSYFLQGRTEKVGRTETPKMVGEPIGVVKAVRNGQVTLRTPVRLSPGDGVCFFDYRGELRGTTVNAAGEGVFTPSKAGGISKGMTLYRNHDHVFLAELVKARPIRRIGVRFFLRMSLEQVTLAVLDEDNVYVERVLGGPHEAARQQDLAVEALQRQLEKVGETVFACEGVEIQGEPVCFLPLAVVNTLRRTVLEALVVARNAQRPVLRGGVVKNDVPYPETFFSYMGNVLNRCAEVFYRRHGVVSIEPAAESGMDLRGHTVMTTRYCIREQLGLCPRKVRAEMGSEATETVDASTPREIVEPVFLVDDEGHRLELVFHCGRCEMEIILAS